MKSLVIFVLVLFLSFTIVCNSEKLRESEEYRRFRRTMGAGVSYINCLAIGNSSQRICSYDLGLLEAIEQQQKNGSRPCPEGKVFRRQCNVCECGHGGGFECSTELCGEDFCQTSGLPRYWRMLNYGANLGRDSSLQFFGKKS